MLVLTGCGQTDGFVTVVIDGKTFQLEPAVDDAARTQGLMHRESISEDGGMIFIFPDAQPRAFWMGYCLVDIDIIYLDAQGRVTAMHRMKTEPPRTDNESELQYSARMSRYPSGFPAQFAIELRAGTLDQLDISVEDKIPLDLPRLKRMAR
ncbi:MAG: DUF192 domain-containing protein [Planctomycetota bacterium]